MRVNDKAYRTIWLADGGKSVEIIDRALLPHRFATVRRHDRAAARAIAKLPAVNW
jgi:methylthioribose-1-phosphate isomerase